MTRSNTKGGFATMVVAIESPAGTIEWARAGHPPPVIRDGQGGRLLEDCVHDTVRRDDVCLMLVEFAPADGVDQRRESGLRRTGP